jgi:hypothetical protein
LFLASDYCHRCRLPAKSDDFPAKVTTTPWVHHCKKKLEHQAELMKLRLLVQFGDDGEFPLCIFIFFDSGIFVMFGLRLIYGFYPLSNEIKIVQVNSRK